MRVPFWPIIGGLLLAILLLVFAPALLLPKSSELWESIPFARILWSAIVCGMLAVVWAIGYRPQLVRGRVSLLAIVVLVTVQSLGLAIVQLALSALR